MSLLLGVKIMASKGHNQDTSRLKAALDAASEAGTGWIVRCPHILKAVSLAPKLNCLHDKPEIYPDAKKWVK